MGYHKSYYPSTTNRHGILDGHKTLVDRIYQRSKICVRPSTLMFIKCGPLDPVVIITQRVGPASHRAGRSAMSKIITRQFGRYGSAKTPRDLSSLNARPA